MLKAFSSLGIVARCLLLAFCYALFWMIVHYAVLALPAQPVWIVPQLFVSTLMFFCWNGFFASFDYYRRRRFAQALVSIIYIYPLFQILYYLTYKNFLDQQNISLLIREPYFLLKIFFSEMTPLRGIALFAGIGIFWFINDRALHRTGLEERQYKPYDVFANRWMLLFNVVMVALQIKWCMDHDLSQLAMRPFYPSTLVALISVIIYLSRATIRPWQRLFTIFLIIGNITLLYTLNLTFVDWRNKFTADSQLYRALFGAFYVQSAFGSLDQSEAARDRYAALPDAKIDYNILVSMNDAQRWDHLSSNGYPKPTDDELDWFLKKSFRFEFPISPANFTDTAVPAVLYGMASDQDVRKIKGSLAVWDYFAKTADTFFVSSQDITWSKLNLMYASVGQKRVWSATAQPGYKGNPEDTNDMLSYDYLKDFLPGKKAPWVGVWQTFASHYPYTVNPEFHRYEPCNLNARGAQIEEFRNCYLNAQVYSAHLRSELFKKLDLDNTVIILTSDHGEGMDEHGIFFHGVDYHQEMVKVPFDLYIPEKMLARLPVQAVENLRKNTKKVTSTTDLVPTLLHLHEMLTGQALVEDRRAFSGHSLFEEWPHRVVFSSHCFPQYRCYSREILFADDDYYVLFRPSEGFYKIYSTWGDLKQEHPLTFDQVDHPKFDRLIEEAARVHPTGQTLKGYYEKFKANGYKEL